MTLYPKIETMFERDEKTFKVCTDKIKNPIFSLISKWEFTEKIDGTNIRIVYNNNKIVFGGRTDNAQIPAILFEYLNEKFVTEQLFEIFGESDIVIYGEGYGSNIQNGRGYSPTAKFIAFDILVNGKWWLSRENIIDICGKLNVDVVPLIGHMTLEEGIELVRNGFKSNIGDGSADAEGIIGKTSIPLFDSKNRRIICKLKTIDFK